MRCEKIARERERDDCTYIREKAIEVEIDGDIREIGDIASSSYEKEKTVACTCMNETCTSVIRIALSGIWNARMECLLLEISLLAVAIAFD